MPTIKTITTWAGNTLSGLQDCFQHTDWDLFEHHNLEIFTETVLDYIKFCMDTSRFFQTGNPWMTSRVHSSKPMTLPLEQVTWPSTVQVMLF